MRRGAPVCNDELLTALSVHEMEMTVKLALADGAQFTNF
jgi:hypothetical protein